MSIVCLTIGGNVQTCVIIVLRIFSNSDIHVLAYMKAGPKSHPDFALKCNLFFPLYNFLLTVT